LEKRVWGLLDVIYYPSESEVDYVCGFLHVKGLSARVLPIPVYAFDTFAENAADNLPKRRDIIFVAGFGHTPNGDGAEWLVHQVMPLVWQEQPHVHLYLVGSNPSEQVKALAGKNVTVTGFVSDEQLARRYGEARVAVAPLRYGGGVKGKVVEAMRFGLPIVTTSVGAQGLSAAENAIAVEDHKAPFAHAVLELLNSDELWARASAAELAFVRENFSIDTLKNILSNDLHFSEICTEGEAEDE
jgi:glycosyltransferase involved in cell wall biosynthesis